MRACGQSGRRMDSAGPDLQRIRGGRKMADFWAQKIGLLAGEKHGTVKNIKQTLISTGHMRLLALSRGAQQRI